MDHSSQTVETNSSFPEGWISLGGGQDDEAGIEILEKTPDFQALALKLPGFFRKVVVIDGKPCSRIDVPGLLKIQEAGNARGALPDHHPWWCPEGGTSRLKIARIVERELKMDMVEPSNGHLSRQVNPANVVPDFFRFLSPRRTMAQADGRAFGTLQHPWLHGRQRACPASALGRGQGCPDGRRVCRGARDHRGRL